MRAIILTSLLIIPFIGASVAEDKKPSKELRKMTGTWRITQHSAGGEALSEEQIKELGAKLVIKGTKYTYYAGKEVVGEGTIKIDATKSPKTIDVNIEKGMGKGETLKGLYKFDGKKWLVIFTNPGGKRPDSFETKKGDDRMSFTYVKVKKKKK